MLGNSPKATCNSFSVLLTQRAERRRKWQRITNSIYNAISEEDPPGGTPILGHIRDVPPEWVSFPGRKPEDGCKFLTKNLRMGHNFDIILPGNGWFSFKLNKTYCSLVNFYCI